MSQDVLKTAGRGGEEGERSSQEVQASLSGGRGGWAVAPPIISSTTPLQPSFSSGLGPAWLCPHQWDHSSRLSDTPWLDETSNHYPLLGPHLNFTNTTTNKLTTNTLYGIFSPRPIRGDTVVSIRRHWAELPVPDDDCRDDAAGC